MQEEIGIKQLRSFGLIIGGIFSLIGLWPTLFRSEDFRLPPLIVGGVLILQALLLPWSLKPFYLAWMTIGEVMGWLNTRIILSIGFYGILMPMGLAMRILGKDPMHRKFDQDTDTYRVVRSSRPGSHILRQF